MKFVLLLVLIFAVYAFGYTKDYHGHSVIRCQVKDSSLFERIMSYTDVQLIDVWKANQITGEIDINLSKQQLEEFNNVFGKAIKCENMIENLQNEIEEEAKRLEKKGDDTFFTNYHSYDDILVFMRGLVAKYSFMYLTIVGNTTQGRPIYGIELNGGSGLKSRNKDGEIPTIYFQGMQHAREWIAPATVLYILNKLAEGYGTDETITRIVDDIYWIFIPVVNIDGYTYTRSNDRLWRKNRRNPPTGSTCYGVDTNRNWPSYWNRGGSSTNPCSETYMGPSAASEVEVQSIMKYFSTLSNVQVSTDWHSYSQVYITPWAWTTANPPSVSNMTSLGNQFAAAIRATSGQTYQVGTTAQLLYVASGSFNDWQYDQYGIIYTQCVELRDTGRYGFLLPASEIIPTGEENFSGVLVQAKQILGNTPLKRKN